MKLTQMGVGGKKARKRVVEQALNNGTNEGGPMLVRVDGQDEKA